jgi:hypothetical protein
MRFKTATRSISENENKKSLIENYTIFVKNEQENSHRRR